MMTVKSVRDTNWIRDWYLGSVYLIPNEPKVNDIGFVRKGTNGIFVECVIKSVEVLDTFKDIPLCNWELEKDEMEVSHIFKHNGFIKVVMTKGEGNHLVTNEDFI